MKNPSLLLSVAARARVRLACAHGALAALVLVGGAQLTAPHAVAASAPAAARRMYDVPADVAEHALKQLSEQSGFEVVFSNAALQWVPDHLPLLPRLLGRVAPGGALALQVPANLDAPPHRVMRELGIVSAAAPAFPLATARMTALRTQAEAQGSSDFTPLWSGQNASGCRAVPAADLTRALARRIVA